MLFYIKVIKNKKYNVRIKGDCNEDKDLVQYKWVANKQRGYN